MALGMAPVNKTTSNKSWGRTKERLRSHVFRIWTAGVVLATYVYAWVYAPEILTWWKRTSAALIEAGCGLLPYPWGDRIEATIGNFGLWVQVTLAIIVFRIVVWMIMAGLRFFWTASRQRRERTRASPVRDGR